MFSYQKSFVYPTMPVDEAQFYALVRAREWNDTIDRFRQTGDAQLKRRLPAFIFQATFDETTSKTGRMGRWRKQAATRLTGLVVMDVDHIDAPREAWERMKNAEKADEELGILLVYVTPSGRGLKIVFKARAEWGNLIDNQHAMAAILGVEVDESCKDASRMSFICKESDILFIDKELFTYANKEFAEKYEAQYREGHSGPTITKQNDVNAPVSGRGAALATTGEQGAALHYHGVPYSKIVEAWVGDKPVAAGDRHRTSLILADHLRYITDNDAALIESILRATPFVGEIIAERNEDVAATVRSAREFKMYKNIPQRMQQALKAAGAMHDDDSAQPSTLADGQGQSLPAIPLNLPPLMSLLTSNVEALYKPCVAMSVFAPLQTHLIGVLWRYVDRVVHEPGDMCLLMAPMASGKSCISKPIEYILADIVERDNYSRLREQAWREEMNTKGANKEKPKRPEGLCVQVLVPDMTNAAFVQRLKDAGNRPVYTQMNELDLLTQLRTNGKSGAPTQILRLAFDHDIYGQERVGTQSVNALVRVRWNMNMSTTIQKGRKFFCNAIADGTLSRLSLCTIVRPLGQPMPIFGDYDEVYAARLKPYIDRLNAASGLIECPQAERLISQMIADTASEALERGENASEISNRALLMAYKRAMTLYIAEGAWSEEIEAFVRWSYAYDMAVKQMFFGELIDAEMQGEVVKPQRGRKGLFMSLGERFSRKELQQKCLECNIATPVDQLINVWVNRKYVLRLDADTFENLKKRRDNLALTKTNNNN